MRVFVLLCVVAVALGHPVKENPSNVDHLLHKRDEKTQLVDFHNDENENMHADDIIQKREVKLSGDASHSVEKRDAESDQELDCSQISDENRIACGEQIAENGHAVQKRDAQDVAGVASQDDNNQIAYSNEGAVAKQGEGGQYIYASDFGGPIVQILQHVYKSECCSCGCDCDCPEGEGGEEAVTTDSS